MQSSERASYVPTWYTASMVPASARGPLTFDLDVDVCVVGAGLAGLTAAREIARRGWSVVVVEGRRIAWSASGRNTGFVLPGFAADVFRFRHYLPLSLPAAVLPLLGLVRETR